MGNKSHHMHEARHQLINSDSVFLFQGVQCKKALLQVYYTSSSLWNKTDSPSQVFPCPLPSACWDTFQLCYDSETVTWMF